MSCVHSLSILFLLLLTTLSRNGSDAIILLVDLDLGSLQVLFQHRFGVFRLGNEEVVRKLVRQCLDLIRDGTEAIGSTILRLDICGNLLLVYAGHRIEVVADVAFGWVEVPAAALANHIEAEDLRLVVVNLRRENHRLLVVLEEVVREARAEKCAIDVYATELGNVDFLAAGAEHLEAGDLHVVTQADGENLLAVAQGPWAGAVQAAQELLVNLSHTSGGIDVACMDQAVEVGGLLVQLKELLVSQVLLVGALGVQNHLDALHELVLAQLILQTEQVEGITNVCFVDLNHVLVAVESAKPTDPAIGAFRIIVGWIDRILVGRVVHGELAIARVAVVRLNTLFLHSNSNSLITKFQKHCALNIYFQGSHAPF